MNNWQSLDTVPPISPLEVKDAKGNIYEAEPLFNWIEKKPLIILQPVFTGLWKVKSLQDHGDPVAWRYIEDL